MAISMMGGPGAPPPSGPAQPAAPAPAAGQPAGLDDPVTARQPQAGDPDAVTFVNMVAGLREHVFGKGEQAVMGALQGADEIGRVLGEIVFSLVREAAKQAEQAGRELDMNILMGAATELIDDIAELAQAHGMEIGQKDREFALLYAQQLYVQSQDPSDDDREAAKQQLALQKQSGDLDVATKYVQQRGMEAGADPFDVAGMDGGPQMMEK